MHSAKSCLYLLSQYKGNQKQKQMREEDFYTEDHTCIHCNYEVNYYEEVKAEATILLNKHDENLVGDDRALFWDCFIDQAIEIVVREYPNVRTICDCCHDNEN